MTIEKTFTVQKRIGFGKGFNRRLRCQNIVPGVLYTTKGDNIAVQVANMPLQKLYEEMGRTTVFNLEIDDNGNKSTFPVLIWQTQYHPIKSEFKHIDFFGVDLDKEIKIGVPVKFVGDSPGVKLGGLLETYRNRLILIGKPLDMPVKIVIDISVLELNDSVHIADVKLPEGIRAEYTNNYTVVAIISKAKEEVTEEDAE